MGADKYSVTQADAADGETEAAAALTVIPTQLEEAPVPDRPEVTQHWSAGRVECTTECWQSASAVLALQGSGVVRSAVPAITVS